MGSSLRTVLIGLIGSTLACTCVLACTDDDTTVTSPDADVGGIDASLNDAVAPTDANSDGGAVDSGRQKSCVERPNDVSRPPTDRLPCELIPPGLSL